MKSRKRNAGAIYTIDEYVLILQERLFVVTALAVILQASLKQERLFVVTVTALAVILQASLKR
ncbi:MAG TPA: hypothetical protein V6D12_09430 [Candidatus Obscuribacterales bacterium]